MQKIISISLAVVILLGLFSSCAANYNPDATSNGAGNEDVSFKTSEEIRSGLTNYEINIAFRSKDSLTESETDIKEIRCDEAAYVQIDNSIYYVDYRLRTMYILDAETKTGYKSDADGSLEEYVDIFASYLANWETFSTHFGNAENDKLIGRNCKRYDFEYSGAQYSYWIDDETQICLKFSTISDENEYIMTVEKFEIGNVQIDDLTDISTYEITTLDEFEF